MKFAQHYQATDTDGGALRAAGVRLFWVLSAGGLAAHAQTPPDKSGYHLFHRTPIEFMREMSTDRPDLTESAYTVDAGHFQLEMDFVNATFDRDRSGGGDLRTQAVGVAPLNLKLGLSNSIDVQVVLDTYVHSSVEDRATGTVDTDSGFGDLETRIKVNLWGNDGGTTAMAVMPFVKWALPESNLRNGKAEGGIIVPLAVALPRRWAMGVMAELDFVSDGAGGHNTEFLSSVTFGRDIAGNLGGYVELVTVSGSAPGFERRGQLNAGGTYVLDENTRLDFGCNFGVTNSAPDFNPFMGLSWRH